MWFAWCDRGWKEGDEENRIGGGHEVLYLTSGSRKEAIRILRGDESTCWAGYMSTRRVFIFEAKVADMEELPVRKWIDENIAINQKRIEREERQEFEAMREQHEGGA